MKRQGHLFEKVVSWENILNAAHQAMRGKHHKKVVAQFYFNLEYECLKLQSQLINGSYVPGHYHCFLIHGVLCINVILFA